MKYDVFISYSRKDKEIADEIIQVLDKYGITYFIDRRGISGGRSFPDVIAKAILDSEVVLFLASKNSYKSPYTLNEIAFALEKRKQCIPYIIDRSTLPDGLQLTLAATNWRRIEQHPVDSVLVNDIFEKFDREKPTGLQGGSIPKPERGKRFYEFCYYIQFAVFVPLLLIACSMFFHGYVPRSVTAIGCNTLLVFCLASTVLCTYWVVFKKKKIPFLLLCFLSATEILLVCVLARLIAKYGSGSSLPYQMLGCKNLGGFIAMHGFVWSVSMMELFALLHIALMCIVAFVNIKGRNLWSQLTPHNMFGALNDVAKRFRKNAINFMSAGAIVMLMLTVALRQEWLVALSTLLLILLLGTLAVGYYRPGWVGLRSKKKVLKYALAPCLILLASAVAGYFMLGENTKTLPPPPVPTDSFYAVDLGLPSGTLWANKNIGAKTTSGFGDYYAWGEVKTKSDYVLQTYSQPAKPNVKLLSAECDAATVKLGNEWTMPTKSDFDELKKYCKWTEKRVGRTVCFEIRGRNGNSILLPKAGRAIGKRVVSRNVCGFYWSRSLERNESNKQECGLAYCLKFVYDNPDSIKIEGGYVDQGRSIRAVRYR